MGVLSNNYAQIIPGALISASYVSNIYDVLLGAATESIRLNGSLTVTGSISSSIGFHGTASNAISSSYAVGCTTASYVASTILTITPSNPLPTNVLIGTFAVSASATPKPYFWDGTAWNALY